MERRRRGKPHAVDEDTVHLPDLPELEQDRVGVARSDGDGGLSPYGDRHIEGHILAPFPHIAAHAVVLDTMRVARVARGAKQWRRRVHAVVRQHSVRLIRDALEPGAAVRAVGRETRLRYGSAHEVVTDRLVCGQQDRIALTDVDVDAARGQRLDLVSVDLDDGECMVIDAKPEGHEGRVTDDPQTCGAIRSYGGAGQRAARAWRRRRQRQSAHQGALGGGVVRCRHDVAVVRVLAVDEEVVGQRLDAGLGRRPDGAGFEVRINKLTPQPIFVNGRGYDVSLEDGMLTAEPYVW